MHQGVASKIDTYDQIVGDMVLTDDEVAYMGDDIVDLAVLGRVGLSAAPGGRDRRSAGARGLRERLRRRRRRRARGRSSSCCARRGMWDAIVAAYEAEGQPGQ